ncbi:MAG TPA: YciI family protein [Anaerolineales bacterium]|nr:YciI family protein [Anaerolineales bacterium]
METNQVFGVDMIYDDAQAWQDVQEHFPNMTIYYVFLLKKGPTWSPDPTPEVQALQEAHLANLKRLGEMGRLVLNGPLLDSFATSGEIRGIGVLKAASLTEAQELISTGPMIKVGRLICELHAWMVDKNILP